MKTCMSLLAVVVIAVSGVRVGSASSLIYECDHFTSAVCEADDATNNAQMNYGTFFPPPHPTSHLYSAPSRSIVVCDVMQT